MGRGKNASLALLAYRSRTKRVVGSLPESVSSPTANQRVVPKKRLMRADLMQAGVADSKTGVA
jgi:hypothetical protein